MSLIYSLKREFRAFWRGFKWVFGIILVLFLVLVLPIAILDYLFGEDGSLIAALVMLALLLSWFIGRELNR
jgi:hypothetical protein